MTPQELSPERNTMNSTQNITTCTNPAHDHFEPIGAEVPADLVPADAARFISEGVATLAREMSMRCHDCAKPLHYDYGIEGYRHDDPAAACFLHPATLPDGATLCTIA